MDSKANGRNGGPQRSSMIFTPMVAFDPKYGKVISSYFGVLRCICKFSEGTVSKCHIYTREGNLDLDRLVRGGGVGGVGGGGRRVTFRP